MEIRLANFDEVIKVQSWIYKAANWLMSKEIPQWERFLVFQSTEICLEDYNNNKLYVLVDNKNLIGALSFGKPEKIDKKLWDDCKKSYFLHRLVVDDKYWGKGYGEAMIEWAKKISETDGKKLRLNSVESNTHLYKYYQKQGLKYMGKKFGYNLFQW